VVEHLFAGLRASPEVELSVTGNAAIGGVIQLQQDEAGWKDIPVLRSPFQEAVGRGTQVARQIVSRTLFNRRPWMRFLRRGIVEILPLAERLEMMLPPELLKEFDIFHSTYNSIPGTLRNLRRLQKFLTIYDLIPLHEPVMSGPSTATLRRNLSSLRQDDWICCISQWVKDDICERLAFAPERVFVTTLAASPNTFYRCTQAEAVDVVRSRYNIPRDTPYLLSLCAVEPRKNLPHLIRCFGKVLASGEAPDLRLVLVGGQNISQRDTLAAHIASAGLDGKIILTGYVPDEDLAAIYSAAMAFIFPSLAEGFGLPPLEAMQCGTPVICSNATSLPEVVGEAGILVHPKDEEALCQAMLRLLNSSSLRQELSAAGIQRAGNFSWQKCVQETIAAYRHATS
jgi:glycosyltransferase involved in cell wall biosynthesis